MKKAILFLLMLLMLTSCAVHTPDSLFQTVCSADEALKLAKKTDTVVFEQQGCTSGREVWDSFFRSVSNGKPASVLCAHYFVLDKERISEELYEEEENEYPKLFFYYVEYDGKEYHIKTRESTKETPDDRETFQNLLHLTGEAPETALYSAYDRYVLTDEPSITWEDIEAGLYSSQAGAGYRHFTVYEDFSGWRGE